MKKSPIVIIGVLVLVVLVSGCMNSGNSDKSGNSNITATNKVFENQWIKFKYPGNLNVVDKSQNDSIDVLLIREAADQNNILTGEIQNSVNDKNSMIKVNKQLNSTFETIASKEAISYNDSSGRSAYIFLEGDKGIWIDFDPAYESAFQMVKNTILIKKIPP
jgi:hypothetical protein